MTIGKRLEALGKRESKMTEIEKNKEIKKRLAAEFGFKNVSVKNSSGTASSWRIITITTPDPCPFKQHENPCSYYCSEGICIGNNHPIRGGWGNTVRQVEDALLNRRVGELIKDIAFYTFIADDGYDTVRNCVNTNINFI